jgi:hypothetical protein
MVTIVFIRLDALRNSETPERRVPAAYADQVQKDYDAFHAAVRAGRFPTETSSSEIETPSDRVTKGSRRNPKGVINHEVTE